MIKIYISAKDVIAFFPPGHSLLVQEPTLQPIKIALLLQEGKFQSPTRLSVYILCGNGSWIKVQELYLCPQLRESLSTIPRVLQNKLGCFLKEVRGGKKKNAYHVVGPRVTA